MKWFKHFTDTPDELVVKKVMDQLGVEGYGAYMLLVNFFCKHFSARNNWPTSHTFSLDIWRRDVFIGFSNQKIKRFCDVINEVYGNTISDKSAAECAAECAANCRVSVTKVAAEVAAENSLICAFEDVRTHSKRTTNLTIKFPKLLFLLDEHTQKAYRGHIKQHAKTPPSPQIKTPESPEDIEDIEELKKEKKYIKKEKSDGQPGFIKFWDMYPKRGRGKCSKSQTLKAWEAKKLEMKADAVITGLQRWIKSDDWTDEKYICGTIPFLNQAKWEAEPVVATKSKASSGLALVAWESVIHKAQKFGRYDVERASLTTEERRGLSAIGGWHVVCGMRPGDSVIKNKFVGAFS